MKIQYNLLKQLREIGFEETQTPAGTSHVITLAEGGVDGIYEPTLDELVEACGEHLTELRNLKNLQKRAKYPLEILDEKTYEAVSTNQQPNKWGHGPNMESAVAELLLALKNPTFNL